MITKFIKQQHFCYWKPKRTH